MNRRLTIAISLLAVTSMAPATHAAAPSEADEEGTSQEALATETDESNLQPGCLPSGVTIANTTTLLRGTINSVAVTLGRIELRQSSNCGIYALVTSSGGVALKNVYVSLYPWESSTPLQGMGAFLKFLTGPDSMASGAANSSLAGFVQGRVWFFYFNGAAWVDGGVSITPFAHT